MKPARRKTWAFYTVILGLCLPTAYMHGMNWPLVVLAGGTYLFYVAAIAAEKILLAFANKNLGLNLTPVITGKKEGA